MVVFSGEFQFALTTEAGNLSVLPALCCDWLSLGYSGLFIDKAHHLFNPFLDKCSYSGFSKQDIDFS